MQRQLFAVLQDPEAKLVDAARIYRKMVARRARYDWPEINKAIINRWSEAGLSRIKQLAWSIEAI
jgi:hypothetical protein